MNGKLNDEQVLQWANQLIQGQNVISPNSPLTASHFTKLTNSKTLRPIFTYLVNHVKSNTEARHIKLNIKHAEIKKHLIEDKRDLPECVNKLSLEASIIDTQSAINNEVKKIQVLNYQKEELLQKERELRRRTRLITLGNSKHLKETEKCKQQVLQLQSLLPQWQENETSEEHNKAKLELQKTLGKIEKLRFSVMNEDIEGDEVHCIKMDLWNEIKRQTENFSPTLALLTLTRSARDAVSLVMDTTNQVDLVKDARQLRLKCEADGTFIDQANEGGVIESVRGMLIEMSGSHVKCFLEGHKSTQSAASLSRALESLHSNIQTVVKRVYKDPVLCEAIMNFCDETIHLAGDKAAVAKCQEVANVLQKRVITANKAKEQLLKQQERIFQFNNQVQNGMRQIRCLVQSVDQSGSVLSNRLSNIKEKIDQKVHTLNLPTTLPKNMLSEEILEIQKFPLDHLCALNLDTKSSQYSSSTSLRNIPEEVLPVILNLNQPIVTSEKNIHSLFDKKQSYSDLVLDLKRATCLQQQISQSCTAAENLSSNKIKDLCNKVDMCDEKLEKNIIPLINKTKSLLSSSVDTTSKMDTLLNNWWDQPAQHIKLE